MNKLGKASNGICQNCEIENKSIINKMEINYFGYMLALTAILCFFKLLSALIGAVLSPQQHKQYKETMKLWGGIAEIIHSFRSVSNKEVDNKEK